MAKLHSVAKYQPVGGIIRSTYSEALSELGTGICVSEDIDAIHGATLTRKGGERRTRSQFKGSSDNVYDCG